MTITFADSGLPDTPLFRCVFDVSLAARDHERTSLAAQGLPLIPEDRANALFIQGARTGALMRDAGVPVSDQRIAAGLVFDLIRRGKIDDQRFDDETKQAITQAMADDDLYSVAYLAPSDIAYVTGRAAPAIIDHLRENKFSPAAALFYRASYIVVHDMVDAAMFASPQDLGAFLHSAIEQDTILRAFAPSAHLDREMNEAQARISARYASLQQGFQTPRLA